MECQTSIRKFIYMNEQKRIPFELDYFTKN